MQVSAKEDFNSTREMAIPMPWGGVLVNAGKILAVVGLFILAVASLLHGIAPIASCLWIAIVLMILWGGSREEGGLRGFLVNLLGDVARRHFVEVTAGGGPSRKVRLGYRLFGHRFITISIALNKIETVEWSTRRAASRATADRKDWHVRIWFDHDDPAKSEKYKQRRKPEQDICIVGPYAAKATIESLGCRLVSFLSGAGATLTGTDTPTCYIRQEPETNRAEGPQRMSSVRTASALHSSPSEA